MFVALAVATIATFSCPVQAQEVQGTVPGTGMAVKGLGKGVGCVVTLGNKC